MQFVFIDSRRQDGDGEISSVVGNCDEGIGELLMQRTTKIILVLFLLATLGMSCEGYIWGIAKDDGLPGDVDGGDCSESCGAGQYTACTCRSDDPCGWTQDGHCDSACQDVLSNGHFDDSVDCDERGAPCAFDCDARRYSACTCGADDPCGWSINGICEAACGTYRSHFDDSDDCDQQAGGLTFAVTAVSDDLNSSDMDDVTSGLEGLGYSRVVRDTDVTTAELISYLGMDIDTLYHTGHGVGGVVMTSDGMFVRDSTTISARNTIFATCLTLQQDWSSAFGPTAETIMGYTEVTFDLVDNEAAQAYVSRLGAGHNHLDAWYLANSGIATLSDRWAVYARRDGSIVEYSARSGNRPVAALNAEYVELGRVGGVFVAESVLEDERTYVDLFAEVTRVAEGELQSHFESGGLGLLGETTMTIPEAVSLAGEWLTSRGELPSDAVVERVVTVSMRRSASDPHTAAGFVVRYIREIDGIAVRSNLVEDHIAVLVGPTGVVSTSSFWPEVSVGPGEASDQALISVGRATLLASDALSRAIKGGEVHIIEALPVYATLGLDGGPGELLPAYQLNTISGIPIVVSALTGEPVL